MPHIEIKYSDNLEIDTLKVFDAIEKVINENDNNAGECKSRAYPCSQYKYSHIIVIVSLLTKPHRDEAFTKKLSEEIETIIKSYLNQSAYFSLSIEYSKPYYTTNIHLIEGDEPGKINQKDGC
jgi:5-carboxymethyl-2-hydroxymuconate isomerase